MTLELDDDERTTLRRALETYVSDLREEIAKTEKHEWRQALHKQEDILTRVISRLA